VTEQELNQFHELLPFYVNGTLSDTDKIFIEQCLVDHPKLQAEIDFTEHLKTAFQSIDSQRNAATGLDNLLQTIEKSNTTKKESWLSKLSGFLTQQATPVFVTLSMVIFIQSFFLLTLFEKQSAVSIVSVANRSMLDSPTPIRVKLTLSPSVSFGTVVALLQETGTRIVNGPSESGEIWIEFYSQVHFKKMIKTIRSSPAVIDFIVIKRKLL